VCQVEKEKGPPKRVAKAAARLEAAAERRREEEATAAATEKEEREREGRERKERKEREREETGAGEEKMQEDKVEDNEGGEDQAQLDEAGNPASLAEEDGNVDDDDESAFVSVFSHPAASTAEEAAGDKQQADKQEKLHLIDAEVGGAQQPEDPSEQDKTEGGQLQGTDEAAAAAVADGSGGVTERGTGASTEGGGES
jgi:hypothetical protein